MDIKKELLAKKSLRNSSSTRISEIPKIHLKIAKTATKSRNKTRLSVVDKENIKPTTLRKTSVKSRNVINKTTRLGSVGLQANLPEEIHFMQILMRKSKL